ncbi:hypothetical protein PYW07_012335 [Mythimna separata]|uniref:SOCS box domain-containing protein n=1 Tax=Mythimna separata TaxID=271217 RepID=A0AAD7YL00_MYTSE|nr:hypothetical protein PYW07_012335 [Mythimna separata]
MPFEESEKITIVVTDTEATEGREFCDDSVELIRKCSEQDTINTSWDPSFVSAHENKDKDYNKTPPFVSVMASDDPNSTLGNSTNSSTQTEPFVTLPVNCSFVDVSVSFGKDFNIPDTKSNGNSEQCLGYKRCRSNSSDGDHKGLRPWKKQCSDSCSSSVSDLTEAHHEHGQRSCLSSNSDVSFKSINSNQSFKVRKRRMKSESDLFRDALQRSRKNSSFSKRHDNTTPGGTPRKERSCRRNSNPKAWKIVDLCAWIGRKGYQSITGLYSDILREPLVHRENNDSAEELRELRRFLEQVDKKQERLAQENEYLKEGMKKMMDKIEQLEGKLRKSDNPPKPTSHAPPPPPPPPPPPLPPPVQPPMTKLPVRAHTLPRCGSAPPGASAQPHLTITPQDIANVKLRKTRDNPIRSKPVSKEAKQPLVTQQMLQSTRAKLGRARPIASSTPKQQLTELENCLLQESSVTSLYRRRVVRNTFRSAEELRPRPYPSARCSRSPLSPRTTRANSLPRVKQPISPLKFPNDDIANYGSTEGVTPLHIASSHGSIELIQLLIEYGAIIDVQDADGDTPLHDAALASQHEALITLLYCGANPEIKNEPGCFTPFHLACCKGFYPNVEALFPFITNINQVTSFGDSPLTLALQGLNDEIVLFLLNHGVDPDIKNLCGEMAIDIALRVEVNPFEPNVCPPLVYAHHVNTSCFHEVFKILIEHGCNVDYCSTAGLASEEHVPDAFFASTNWYIPSLPIMVPYSIYCEPGDYLQAEYERGNLSLIPLKVQRELLYMLDSDSNITAETLTSHVLSLKHICRYTIRRLVRKKHGGVKSTQEFLSIIDSLPLPRILKNYLRYM